MNLVQIQEHLKDLPTQVLMSYANGQSPQVPPYLALGELNRRKQMEQRAAQPPQGTVKDNIQQQVGMMQMQKMRQAMPPQMPQQMPQQAPEAAPQPEAEMAMAAGGVTSLPMREMNFGSGGIIAFANPEGKQLVEDKEVDEDLPLWAIQPRRERERKIAERKKLEEERARNMAAVANEGFVRPAMENDPRLVGNTPAAETVGTIPQPAPAVPPGGIANVVPPRPPAPVVQNAPAPQMPQQAAPASPLLDELKSRIAQATPTLPDYETERAAAAAKNPYLTMVPGKRIEEGIAGLRAGYDKQQAAFEQAEKDRARAALWQGLIEGGESTRGLRNRGIGSIGTGAGKSFLSSMEGARTREMAQQELVTQRNFNLMKMENELESARIADAKGDFKAAYDHKVKAAEFKQNADDKKNQLLSQGAQIESADNRDIMRLRNEKELAALRYEYERKLKNIPQAQRATFEEQYVEEAVKRGVPKLEAMRQAKTLGVEAKGQMTYAQATDDVDKWLATTQGLSYISGLKKAAKDKGQPMPDEFTIRKNLIEQQMQQSGSSNAPKPNSELLKAADAIVGGVK